MVVQRFRPAFSGQGEQLELLCRVLARRGLEPTIITPGHERRTTEEQLDGYRVVRLRSDMPLRVTLGLGARARGPAFASRTLSFLFARRTFDLVHVHALTDALYASWLWCRWSRKPLLFEMTLMGADDPPSVMATSNRLARLRQAIFRRCDGYVAISPALEEQYHGAGFPRDRVRLVPQGVDIHQFRPVEDRVELRRQLGLPETEPVLILVGSLIRRKGIDLGISHSTSSSRGLLTLRQLTATSRSTCFGRRGGYSTAIRQSVRFSRCQCTRFPCGSGFLLMLAPRPMCSPSWQHRLWRRCRHCWYLR